MTATLACNVRGGVARFEREGRWSRGRIYAAVKQWTAADCELDHRRREHTVVMTLTGGTSLTGNAISSTLRYEGVDRSGSVSFVPAGAERRGWYRDANMTFVALVIAPDLGPVGELAAFTNRRDPILERILRELAGALHRAPTAYVEGAAAAVLADAAIPHELVVYPTATHGFFCDQRDTFDPVARDDAWQRVLALVAAAATKRR